ncbi:very low-density lipoprotein receptor [Zeugodacus cucurbitae]|uniref:Low-density lipoprotein receptor n=1 Tax=Zeugodacus cucurbitae TaxID=28588 RepID=A0A0A1X375_ZEUCU|nr:very low-density lipoprotein receptor [Zeugodacus cucurbitae]
MRSVIFSVLICYISVVINADNSEECEGSLCNNGECIDQLYWCDGSVQCEDKSDEMDCKKMLCGDADFKCYYGACIAYNKTCDKEINCLDGSDEWSDICKNVTPCPADKFQCGYGGCVDLDKKCDGTFDCPDQTDELPPLCDGPLLS